MNHITNYNWVCFACRMCLRGPVWVRQHKPFWTMGDSGEPQRVCPNCRRACVFLGDRVRVPARHDMAKWRKLQKFVYEARNIAIDRHGWEVTRKKHRIERRIRELESRPPNPERNQLIARCREELADLG